MRTRELALMPCYMGSGYSNDGKPTIKKDLYIHCPVLITFGFLKSRDLQSVLRGIELHVNLSAIAM